MRLAVGLVCLAQRAEGPLAEVGYDLEEPEEPEEPQEPGDERKPDLYYANNGVLKTHYVYDDAGVLREEIEYNPDGSVHYVLEHRSDGTVWQRAGDQGQKSARDEKSRALLRFLGEGQTPARRLLRASSSARS